MRIVRFRYKANEGWGLLEDKFVLLLDGSPFGKIKLAGRSLPLNKIRLLPPATPDKIILVGLNYRDHARELNMRVPKEPVIFLKPDTALIAHKQDIRYPKGVARLDYEAELAFVVRKEGRSIPEAKAKEYILGYTCLNDVTARDLQKKDIQWTRSKSFDTFCPVGPWLETEVNPHRLAVRSYLNGVLKQESNTSNFIFPVSRLLHFISGIMTLSPGDIISTGTPPGVGRMLAGDTVEIAIEGVGSLINRVVK
jgi:2-keto-4-pentenoate hydratase/2-oxohepta-3-ene-1,7-dioic acid hydratase in catechol pathway